MRLSIRVLAEYPWRRVSLAVNRLIGRTRRAAVMALTEIPHLCSPKFPR